MRYNKGRHLKCAALTFFERNCTMKRIIALILCLGMFAAAAAGCGGQAKEPVATGDEAKSKSVSDYKNTYEGLLNYLSAWGYINPLKDNEGVTYTNMTAELIGAKQGRRFTAMNTKNTTIEIYEYDLNKLDATADEVRSSVEKNNTFQNLFDEKVNNVYLTKNGRYMMIYNDTSINDDTKDTDENYKNRQECIDKFLEFDK